MNLNYIDKGRRWARTLNDDILKLDKIGLTKWTYAGIKFVNGAYCWDIEHNPYNCAYRYVDFGNFKIVEIRLVFAVNHDIVSDTKCIELPQFIKPDEDEEIWQSTGIRAVMIHTSPDMSINVYCQQFGPGEKYTAHGILSFHTTYFTTN